MCEAMLRGLASVVPIKVLSLFSWEELAEFTCGVAKIDVQLLRSVTEYSGCSSKDDHVKYFWTAMSEFSNEERQAFLRFVWSRSRLPRMKESFSQRFKLQNCQLSPPDQYYPVAHTCFFSLELPRYSSLEITKEKLRYAIFNCSAIDADDTDVGLAAAQMGWEE